MKSLGLLLVLVLGLFAGLAHGLYDHSRDDVVELTADNFDKLTASDVWVVEFYAEWCGHCQQLAPEYKKAATALKGIAKVGAVDMDQHQALGQRFGVQGFPTIKIFNKAVSATPEDYQGARTASAIAKSALKSVTSLVRARLDGKTAKTGSSNTGKASSGEKKAEGKAGAVVIGTSKNFKSEVLESEVPVLVAFVAPWCGHCKNLKPNWKAAAAQMQGRVKFVQVDATVEQELAGRYGVRGYPTIKFRTPAGGKKLQDYNSGRSTQDLVGFAQSLLGGAGAGAAQDEAEPAKPAAPPVEVKQLLSAEQWSEACPEDKLALCVFVALPHILDSGASGRNGYLDTMKEVAGKLTGEPFQFLWAEAGEQGALEQSLDLGGAGYPALAVVSRNKAKYVPYMGAFSAENLGKFLRRVKMGREATVPLPAGELKVVTSSAWDGKDGEAPVHDEI